MRRNGMWMTLALALAGCGDDGGGPTPPAGTTGDPTTGGPTTAPAATTGAPDPTTGADTTGAAPTTGDDSSTGDDPTTGGAAPPVYLTPTDHLVRASMALRGIRPSLEELQQVADDPAALPGIVDTYLDDPLFAETVKDIYAEALLMRAHLTPTMLGYKGPLLDLDDATYLASVPEEPLKIIEHVIREKRSFADIVTTDDVWVNEVGAAAWRVTGYDPDLGGWQKVQWDDERPKGGGVLTSAGLWHRHPSNGKNYHRARANLVARVFLCDDYLTRDVPPFTDVDFSDDDAVKNALQQNPGCVSCHQTMDPLAGFFWGVATRGRAAFNQAYDMDNQCLQGKEDICYPTLEYKATAEQGWKNATGRAPGYFGAPEPDGGLDVLGEHVAADPRFAQCVARRFYSYMAQVQLDAVPFAQVDALTGALQTGDGLDAHALARAIVLSDEFRASHTDTADGADELVGLKAARPEQLERMFVDLTGYRWVGMRQQGDVHGEFPLLASDAWGYRAMAGGIDGYSITQPTWTFNPTRTLVLQALAVEAAAYVVDRDLDTPMKPARRLLQLVDEGAAEPEVRAQIARLHLRVLGEFVADDGEEVDLSYALWSGAAGDDRRKWKLLLAAMLQDHRVAFY